MANSNATTMAISLATIIKGYEILNDSTKIKLEVTGNPSASEWVNPKLRDGKRGATYKHSHFINVKAIESRKVPSIIAEFCKFNGVKQTELSKEDLMALEMPLSKFNHNMTKEVISHTTDKKAPILPMKGEMIECVIGYAKDTKHEDGYARDKNGQKVLEIANYVVPQATTTSGVSWDSFLGSDEVASDERESIVDADEVEAEDKF